MNADGTGQSNITNHPSKDDSQTGLPTAEWFSRATVTVMETGRSLWWTPTGIMSIS